MTSPAPARIVDALVGDGLLAPSARDRALTVVGGALEAPPAAEVRPRTVPQLVEVVAYLGGALVLAAAALFVVQQWDDLGFGAHVALLAVAALVLGVAGVVVGRGAEAHDVRRRLGGTLVTASALALAFLTGYVVDEVFHPSPVNVYWPAVAGSAVGALAALVGYRLVPTALGQLGAVLGFFTALANGTSGIPDGWWLSGGDAVGLSVLALGVVWLALAERGVFRERQVARALGAATALVGAQSPVLDGSHPWLGYVLTVAVAGAGVAAYLRLQAWPHLALAVLAVTLVVPEAVTDWSEGSLGAAGGVLVAGVTLLLASLAGYRLRSEALS